MCCSPYDAGLEHLQAVAADVGLWPPCRTEEEELQQELTDKRYIFQDYIAGERLRGLAWLLTWTVLAIWITGILNKESPLAP